MTSKPTIYYFEHYPKARGCLLQICLEAAGAEYNYVAHTKDEWGKLKAEGKYPLPFLPAMDIDGEYLQETMALLTYIGEKYDMFPGTAIEKAKALELVLTFDEVSKKVYATFGLPEDEKKKAREEVVETAMRPLVEIAAKLVAKRAGKFCFGDKVSVADGFITWQYLMCSQVIDHLPADLFTKHEMFRRIIDNTLAIPKVAALLKGVGFKLE